MESLNAGVPVVAVVEDANCDHAWKNMTQEAQQTEILRPAAMALGDLETVRPVGAARVVFVANNAASGYVKALQHAVHREGKYQSSDLVEMNCAAIAAAMGAAAASAGRTRSASRTRSGKGWPTRTRRR